MDLNLSDATAIQTAFVEQLRKQHHLSASHIQRLCGWAHSYAPSHASTLFHCILRHLQDSLPAYKISCLYLLDALLKASLGSSKNLPEDITVSASAKRAYVQLICDNLEVILQEFLLANGSGVDEMSQFASNLLVRFFCVLWSVC